MITIYPLKALNDNYIWVITHSQSKQAIIVDPGEAEPVLKYLQKNGLTLSAILITHHHWDHTNGIKTILQHHPTSVYGPATEQIPLCTHPVEDNDQISWPDMGIEFTILAIPGHTRGHIAYYGHNSLFCGDTLFTGGCGRLFEGTAAQMYSSLSRIAALPGTTEIYCGHEYTQANLRFARIVDPENTALARRIHETNRLRQNVLPTVPASLDLEKQTNPFLRCHLTPIQESVNHHLGQFLAEPVATFAALRQWKDQL